MKHTKKLLVMALCAVMVMAVGVLAFAKPRTQPKEEEIFFHASNVFNYRHAGEIVPLAVIVQMKPARNRSRGGIDVRVTMINQNDRGHLWQYASQNVPSTIAGFITQGGPLSFQATDRRDGPSPEVANLTISTDKGQTITVSGNWFFGTVTASRVTRAFIQGELDAKRSPVDPGVGW